MLATRPLTPLFSAPIRAQFIIALLIAFLLPPGHAQAQAQAQAQLQLQSQRPATDPCRAAIAIAERMGGIPDRLMQAVAIIESGRKDALGNTTPWPWTINVEGVGEIFETKQQAIAAVLAHQARGARSIDVGCMQINLMHHPDAFPSLDRAFDPMANTAYAARFLQQLLGQTGSWPRAVAAYHSLTPDIGGEYARKVLAVWARPDLGQAAPRMASNGPNGTTMASSSLTSPTQPYAGPASPALPSASTRSLSMPTATAPVAAGRGLDSYRSIPTRLATAGSFRRS